MFSTLVPGFQGLGEQVSRKGRVAEIDQVVGRCIATLNNTMAPLVPWAEVLHHGLTHSFDRQARKSTVPQTVGNGSSSKGVETGSSTR